MTWHELASGEFFNMDQVETLSVTRTVDDDWGIVLVGGSGVPKLLKRRWENEEAAREELGRMVNDQRQAWDDLRRRVLEGNW